MCVNKNEFREVIYKYNGKSIYFYRGYKFHNHFGHKRKIKQFPYHKNLLDFLFENPDLNIYFTADKSVAPFKRFCDDLLVNIDSYLEFCKLIQNRTTGRAQAFFGQNIRLGDMTANQEERDEFVRRNATEKNIMDALSNLDDKSQQKILEALQKNNSNGKSNISSSEFIDTFSKFLTDQDAQSAFFKNLPKFQIETLKKLLSFLSNNLEKDEKFIQEWIDEDEGKYRKQRCLIFGIEYVDPKREGRVNEKRFDILADQNKEHHVLIELKSPSASIFDVDQRNNLNGGITTDYRISFALARAIPQILSYKKWYEEASAEEIQALGIPKRKPVSKCIIIIGKNIEDEVWKENFDRIKNSVNIEIYTYSDLIDKLENTIRNLEENL